MVDEPWEVLVIVSILPLVWFAIELIRSRFL